MPVALLVLAGEWGVYFEGFVVEGQGVVVRGEGDGATWLYIPPFAVRLRRVGHRVGLGDS